MRELANVKGIIIEIGGSATGLVNALKDVNNRIKTTQTEIRTLQGLLRFDPKNTELLTQKQHALADAVKATKEKFDTLKTAQQQAEQQLKSGNLGRDKYNALQQEIIRTEQELKRLVAQSVEANTALSTIGNIGSTLTDVGRTLSTTGRTLTTALTLPIVGFGTVAVRTGMGFDAAMTRVRAISNASGEDFDRLRDKAREMGAKTRFSAAEAAEAMYYMAMAGWDTEKMLSGIEGVMNLAAASGENLALTSDIVTDALTAFKLGAENASHFSDVLAATASNSNTNVALLGESFQYAATTAGSYKFSIEDVSLALGLMANSGVKGTQAGNNLKNALVNLTKPTKKQALAMKELGLITTEYVKTADPKKVEKAQKKVEDANQRLLDARERYNIILKESGSSSAAAVTAHNNIEKAQIKTREASNAVSEAQKKYNQAVQTYGAKSKEAVEAGKKLSKAQNKLKTATLNLDNAQIRYNNALKSGTGESPKAVAARQAVERAERKLTEAQDGLAKAQEGVQKAGKEHNLLLEDEHGNVRDLDSILRLLRSTLGQTNVEVVDSNGELRDFDTILQDVAEHSASLT